MRNSTPHSFHSDALCIGFGPAGIALACAFEDAREANDPSGRLSLRYLEAAADTHWHRELLLAGTDINHHVFRDLVTPRNPRSRFSFAMYLKDKGRMFDFGLLGRPASRHEWSDYLAWVSSQADRHTRFNAPVTEIDPVVRNGRLHELRVRTPDASFTTRNLILSSGSAAHIPEPFRALLGPRLFHTSQFLTRLQALGEQLPKRWLVLGSGQSASESVLELISRRSDIEVHSVHRSAGFKLTQLGQFPNRVFAPDHVDYFHSLEPLARQRFLDWSRSTNYAGIDPDESQKLFSLIYEDAIVGRKRLQTYAYSEITGIEHTGDGYRVTLTDTFSQRTQVLEVDVLVLGTGYQQYLVPPLLSGLQPWLKTATDGGLLIDRDYRVATEGECDVTVWVNGLSERSHGISDSQSFSLMALRAERIANALGQAVEPAADTPMLAQWK
ncbi:Lysine N6-hydroxylase/L-ornithine N5-oxygenase family protein [Pseudomonas syringae pv. cilantro]|uniref:Lysine N6-hydroxylase/L-ornithine N5-oxygenase family protein n=2 Tax=Pseudomonas syringae group TaxID=136849 RepID=A0A0N0GC86_PSESX|nr:MULTISPECIES: SidA/IucD/PvdA family monooxygenase [Pseudomonas syringae group]KPC23664.1 Lysine N6-hydroxylase/L-ornithine N5-oxygenase family protein [Pseudomonas syringae pv. cilantro]KPW76951.1 Lysine N6-hydroxylase/L-ornithine N5-oxygenase family protein [Pseudomonas syringae pv. coriandricola]RMN09629.1 Lysine N6-hydroxylase/L-ornithine N5-oxygenase protein [Pseudomonas syringae pv. coriandricola]